MDDLINCARAGDQDALNQLLLEARPLLRMRAEREKNASSVVQNTLLYVSQHIGAFRGSTREEFRVWLYKILGNKAVDKIRADYARGKGKVMSLDAAQTDGDPLWTKVAVEQSSPSARVQRNEEWQRLERALCELPSRQRVAVRMRRLEGRSLADVGKVLQCTEAAAGQLVARGIAALQQLLDIE